MVRRTALVLVLALAAVSARQLTCVWECSEPTAQSEAGAPCHETASDGPMVGANADHCPLAPDAAVMGAAKIGEPQRQRLTVPFDKVASAMPALAHEPTVRAAFIRSSRPAPTPPARTFSVLRI